MNITGELTSIAAAIAIAIGAIGPALGIGIGHERDLLDLVQ